MDFRKPLPPDTELRFGPDTRYSIRGEVGRGGSCIVYDAAYRTNAGDEKTVRIRECYPFDLRLERGPDLALICPPEESALFEDAREQMYKDFRLCDTLFYADPVSDSIINTINIYETNNTVYTVSAWARENALPHFEITTLRDCVAVILQTALAISCIHQAGYLYLDIKPDNISVINGVTKRVQLFDFDSLIPVSAVRENADCSRYRLSYTRGFAALELRREQFSRLGFHTDVYGIGALLFFLLFGRTPEAPDCAHGASYDFSAMRFGESYPDRLFLLLENFFRKTLAGFYPDRYEDMERVCRELEEISRLCDPARPYLISSPFSAPDWFIGREAEAEHFADWCRDETRNVLFLSGMGGIGKSTFVRRCLSARRRDWDSIAILYYSGSIRQTLLSDSMLRINGTERFPEEKEADYFERKMKKLRGIARRDRVLLVFDNFEGEHDPDLALLSGMGCKTLFITRHDPGSLNFPVLKLGTLPDPADLGRLFLHYLGAAVPSDTAAVQAIIRRLDGHTLALELFARQIANAFLSLPEALELLETRGLLHVSPDRIDYQRDGGISYEGLAQILTRLFETDRLTEPEISLLKAAALFPAPGIEARELLRLARTDEREALSRLIRYGWITRERERVYLHPLIRDVVRDLPGTEASLAGVRAVLETLTAEIVSQRGREELNCLHPETFPPEVLELDPGEILTDRRALEHSAEAARTVIDVLADDPELSRTPLYRRLLREMLLCLPWHEDEAILRYGAAVLANPDAFSPAELMDVYDVMEKVLLDRSDYDGAFALVKDAERFAADPLTQAEHCALLSSIFDVRDDRDDPPRVYALLETEIKLARKAPRLPRNHLLASRLIGKMNLITRSGFGDEDELDAVIAEVMELIKTECLPLSEIRADFATAMGFYWAEVEGDREETEKWIALAREISEKRRISGLDFIENAVVPPAIMYIDLGDFEASENMLLEGIRICEAHADLAVYRRKKHDLHRSLLDVCCESGAFDRAEEILADLDDECETYGYPDTVQPEVRRFLAERS